MQNQQKSVLEQIELLELDKSGIHVAEYLTVLPLKEVLQAKLQEAIAKDESMNDDLTQTNDLLFQEIRQLIDTAKQRAAVVINAEITLLYWQVGKRIHTEVLQGQRAEYGKQIIVSLSTNSNLW